MKAQGGSRIDTAIQCQALNAYNRSTLVPNNVNLDWHVNSAYRNSQKRTQKDNTNKEEETQNFSVGLRADTSLALLP